MNEKCFFCKWFITDYSKHYDDEMGSPGWCRKRIGLNDYLPAWGNSASCPDFVRSGYPQQTCRDCAWSIKLHESNQSEFDMRCRRLQVRMKISEPFLINSKDPMCGFFCMRRFPEMAMIDEQDNPS